MAMNPKAQRVAPLANHQVIDLPDLDTLPGNAIALFCFSDARPLAGVAALVDWRLCGAVSNAVVKQVMTGDVGEVLLLPAIGRFAGPTGPRRVFLFGLGPQHLWDHTLFKQTCRIAARVMRRAGAVEVVVGAPASHTDPEVEPAFVNVCADDNQADVTLLLSAR